MKTINGYEVGQEPTREELETYWKVQEFLRREWVAGVLGEGELTGDEFELVVDRFEKLDFSAEESDALDFEVQRVLDERPDDGTPYDGPDGEARYREEFGFDECPYLM